MGPQNFWLHTVFPLLNDKSAVDIGQLLASEPAGVVDDIPEYDDRQPGNLFTLHRKIEGSPGTLQCHFIWELVEVVSEDV